MFYSVTRNNIFYSINYINFLNPIKQTLKIKNAYLLVKNVDKNKKLQNAIKTINCKYLNPLILYPMKIKLKTMDDITELADLAEEQEISEKIEDSVMDFEEEFSESSENELTEEELDESVQIEKVPYKENQYQHSFHISRNYYRHIVGSKGIMLKRLCSETKTLIRVSKKKKHVVIIGSVQKRIIHAKRQIDKLIESSKNKLKYTHFISIPTNEASIKENFKLFKEDVLSSCDIESSGFNVNMFQRPEKLHLTICMLHLLEDIDEQKAIEALNNCKKNIIDPILKETGPLKIEFRGLKCMGNNPTKAKVLYFNVNEETGSLQKMSDKINDYFVEQGLSRREYEKVTLHMTVINTFYLKKKKELSAKKNFDATNILKEHKNTYLGKITLSTFHISKLTAKSADGYFEATAKILF